MLSNMGDYSMMDYHELDMLVAQLEQEKKELEKRVKLAEQECAALREQINNLERQVYNGPTM